MCIRWHVQVNVYISGSFLWWHNRLWFNDWTWWFLFYTSMILYSFLDILNVSFSLALLVILAIFKLDLEFFHLGVFLGF